jgi:hypothetical protein
MFNGNYIYLLGREGSVPELKIFVLDAAGKATLIQSYGVQGRNQGVKRAKVNGTGQNLRYVEITDTKAATRYADEARAVFLDWWASVR